MHVESEDHGWAFKRIVKFHCRYNGYMQEFGGFEIMIFKEWLKNLSDSLGFVEGT